MATTKKTAKARGKGKKKMTETKSSTGDKTQTARYKKDDVVKFRGQQARICAVREDPSGGVVKYDLEWTEKKSHDGGNAYFENVDDSEIFKDVPEAEIEK